VDEKRYQSRKRSYIQLSVRTADSDINGIQLQMYEVGSTSYGVNDKDIISHSDLDQSALIDNTWHHHAFSLAKVDGTLYADYYYDGLHRKETTIPGSWQNITGSVTLFIASGSFISDSLSIGFP
jgi:hypothetical protein